MTICVFPDNTVLCNFAAVGALNLLQKWLDDRGRWTEAVAYEASRSARYIPDLASISADGWLGEPLEIDKPSEIREIEAIRRAVFGGTEAEALKHLGEAQTLYVVREYADLQGSIWVSDDKDALEYARHNQIPVKETMHIVAEAVQYGWITVDDGFTMLEQMDASKQGSPRRPAKPSDLSHM